MTSLCIMFFTILTLITCYVSAEFRIVDGGNYWISFPLKRNWNQAQRHCKKLGMNLVEIMNIDENERIKTMLQDTKYSTPSPEFKVSWWIGGTDQGTEGVFYWASTGEEFEFDDFGLENPDNLDGEENCVELWKQIHLQWNDRRCDRRACFICRQSFASQCPPQI